jgi:hypothetical protein
MSILNELDKIIATLANDAQVVTEKKTEDKWIQKANVKKSKLHDLLGLEGDVNIASKYTSGETLGNTVAKKLGGIASVDALTKAIKMLTFASNMPNSPSIFKVAKNSLLHKKEELIAKEKKAKK